MADDTNISFRSPLLSSVSFSFPYGSLASEHFFQNSYLLFKDLGRQRSGVGWGGGGILRFQYLSLGFEAGRNSGK